MITVLVGPYNYRHVCALKGTEIDNTEKDIKVGYQAFTTSEIHFDAMPKNAHLPTKTRVDTNLCQYIDLQTYDGQHIVREYKGRLPMNTCIDQDLKLYKVSL
jgi:hypothetical protein